ncbi:hypothetical protein ACFWAY_09360 [Rhodococcus sp. NPDC059968]|uniref:hypothetical protein n=1 Tax=Rhodococcus sp. NPDC059968 TaxID=3347017 RepID=UPI00366D3200
MRREAVAAPTVDETSGIGIDWDVSVTATTTSPGFDLPYLGHRKRCSAELGKAQRKMARRHSGKRGPQSKGYQRARREAAKLHKKAARQVRHDSRCARAKQRLGLAERTFLCRNCGYTDCRDRNAARVILAVAERGHTRVDVVRHAHSSFGSDVCAV